MRRFTFLGGTALVVACSLSCGGGGADGGTGPNGEQPTSGHRIHGTVAGLKGNGTVVQLNGANDLALPSGVPDLFFVNIAEKTPYAITVRTQPVDPWQTCTLANATGTMGKSDIENVTMTCVNNSYTVRGAVSGLTANGLVVQLNGANPITIAPGTTQFGWPGIESGADWDITISAQPAGQTCLVSGSNGRMQGNDATGATITCLAPGLTIGGSASGVGRSGLQLLLNGTTSVSVPAASGAPATDFTFPVTVQPSTSYSVVVATQPGPPLLTCSLARAKGRVANASVTDIGVNCRNNSTLAGVEGTYSVSRRGHRNFLTFWSQGNYSTAIRSEDPACPNSGNGTEYGAYRRASDNVLSVVSSTTDRNGSCGVWDSQSTPQAGLTGTLTFSGNELTLTYSEGTLTLVGVANDPTRLVGSFARVDGIDGSFIVFEGNGTFLFNEAQDGASAGIIAGYERGCYTISGGSFSVSFAASCKPDGDPALDLNGRGGFSAFNGAAIPFLLTSDSTATIGGVAYKRLRVH